MGSDQGLGFALGVLSLSQSTGCNEGEKKGKKVALPKKDPQYRTRPELPVRAITLLAQWFLDREFMVSGDSAYDGKRVFSKLPSNVGLISHVHPKGVLYEEAPAVEPGKDGCPAKKGKRLPNMQQGANDESRKWETPTSINSVYTPSFR